MQPRHLAAAVCLAVFFGVIARPRAAEPAAKPQPPELKLVPADAAVFASFRVADIWGSEFAKPFRALLAKDGPKNLAALEKEYGLSLDAVERLTVVLTSFDARPGVLAFVTTVKPYDKVKLLTAMKALTPAQFRDGRHGFGEARPPLATQIEDAPKLKEEDLRPVPQKREEFDITFQREREAPKLDLDAPYYHAEAFPFGVVIPIDDRTFAVTGDGTDGELMPLVVQLLRRKADGGLADAIATAAGDHHVVVGVNVPAIPADLPLGAQERVLIGSTLKAQSLTATLDFGETIKVVKTLRFADAADAKKSGKTLDALKTLASEMIPGFQKELARDPESATMVKLLAEVERTLDDSTIEVDGTSVIAKVEFKVDTALPLAIAEASKRVGEAARRTKLVNNLKQIGLGMHSYHDAMGVWPGSIFGEKPPVSWRVQILPYIEEDAVLYRMYDFNQPWDSPTNKKLIPLMPKVFEVPGADAGKGKTFLRAFAGRGTFLEPMPNGKGYQPLRIADFTDGLSNTIIVAEADEAEVWTKPEGLAFPEKGPLPKLGGHFSNSATVLMGDGSVRSIKPGKILEATLRAMLTRNGGEVIPSDD